MAALRSVYRPPLPYQSVSTSTSWAVDSFDREFPGDPNGRLIHTGQQLTGARFPNGRVEALEASHFANLMTARAMVNRQTVNEYHVNLESRSGQMVKWQMGLPYEEHSRWDRTLTATFAATTLAAGVGAPAAHATTSQQKGWAREVATAMVRQERRMPGGLAIVSPVDIAVATAITPSLASDQSKYAYRTYSEMLHQLRSPEARKARVLLLAAHGGDALGIGTAEEGTLHPVKNKWVKSPQPKSWELTSYPRLSADLPSNIKLAIIGTCNPRAALGRGDIPASTALHKFYGFGFRAGVVHNLHEDLVIRGGRVVQRIPYHAHPEGPGTRYIAPDYIGETIGWGGPANPASDPVAHVLAGRGTTERTRKLLIKPFRAPKSVIQSAEAELNRVRNELSPHLPAAKPARIARATIQRTEASLPFVPVPGTAEGLAAEGGLLGLLGLSRRRRRRPGKAVVTHVAAGASPPPTPLGIVPVNPSPIAQEAYDFTAPTRFGGSLKKAWEEAAAPVPAPAARPAARPAVRDIPQWAPPVDNRLEELIARNNRDLDRMGRGFTEAAQGMGKVRSNLDSLKFDRARAQLSRSMAQMDRIEARLDRLEAARAAGGIPAAGPAVLHSPVSPAVEATRPEPGVQSIAQEVVKAEARGVGAAAQVEKAAASVEKEAGLHPALIGGGIAAAIVGGLLVAHHLLSGRTLHQRHQNLESKSGKKIKRQMNLPYQEQSRVDPMAAATQALKSFGFGKLIGGSKQGMGFSAEIIHGVQVFRGADPNGAFQGQTVTWLAEAEVWAHGAPKGEHGWHLLGAEKTTQPTADVVRRLIQQEKVGSVLIDSCNPGRSFLPAAPGARVTYGLGYGVASSQERQGIGAVRSWLDAVVVGEGETSRIYSKSALQAELERRGLDPRGLPTRKLRTVKGDFLEGDTSTLGIFQTAAGEARLTAHPIGQTAEEVMKYSLALHEAPHIKMSRSGGAPVFETGGQRFHTFEEASSSLTRSIRAQTRAAAGANRLLQGAGLKAEEAATKSFSMGNLFRLRMLSPVQAAKQMVNRVTLNAHHVNLESRVGQFLKRAMRLPFKAHSQVDPLAAAQGAARTYQVGDRVQWYFDLDNRVMEGTVEGFQNMESLLAGGPEIDAMGDAAPGSRTMRMNFGKGFGIVQRHESESGVWPVGVAPPNYRLGERVRFESTRGKKTEMVEGTISEVPQWNPASTRREDYQVVVDTSEGRSQFWRMDPKIERLHTAAAQPAILPVKAPGVVPVTTADDLHAAAAAPVSPTPRSSAARAQLAEVRRRLDELAGKNNAAKVVVDEYEQKMAAGFRAMDAAGAKRTATQQAMRSPALQKPPATTVSAGAAAAVEVRAASRTTSQVAANVENEAKAVFHGPVLLGILAVGALVAGGLSLSHHHHPASAGYSSNRHPAPDPPTKKHEKQEIETRTERREIGQPRSNTRIRLTDADLNMETVDEIFSNHFKRGYAYS